ncbi:Testis-expressed sequence 10 protein [Grifola frondosa]|uniref:Pre-rRNA-processing protein n=1 Tax=Grifola frondosa TaxID=5627 RepID=A0A1C7MT03_GRIFR|nr:Testis-expressed sequence 10 protein [Grifola frondosa]
MPKSSKKKKDKAADFSKAKLKLGKGKQVATNAVDTSFKARSIALPTQSIANEKDTEAPSTKRRLTFDDLIAHLKHYNAGTRKDAILGLRELLEAHPDLINPRLTALVNNCVRIIGDEDASVRKTLLSFFGWLLRRIPPDDLVPHSPVLLLFTTSAQTHIFPEIRIDAVRFLDLFLEVIPSVVVEGWTQGSSGHGQRVLEGYLGILNAGTTFGESGGPVQATSTASVILSPASKLVVLKSLSLFLSHALLSTRNIGPAPSQIASTSSPPTPTWYLSSSFSSSSAYNTFDSLIRPAYSQSSSECSVRHWAEEVDPETFDEDFVGNFEFATASITAGWTLQDLTNVDVLLTAGADDRLGGSAELARVVHLTRTLHSTLVSTFLDCAPTVFSPSSSPPETELQMVLVVCEICRTLYGAILQDSAQSSNVQASADLKLILGYLSPYFPFTVSGSSTARRDIKVEQAFQDLNLIFCELSSFLVLSSPSAHTSHPHDPKHRPSRVRRGPTTAQYASPAPQIERVSEYVVQLLRGEASPGSLPRPITPAAYTALLPTIWSLINSPTAEASDVLRVVVEQATRASSQSTVKRHTVDFLGRLILLEREAEYAGVFGAGRSAEEDSLLAEWIVQLPKTMWELGATHLPLTEVRRRSPPVARTNRARPDDPASPAASLPAQVMPDERRDTLVAPRATRPLLRDRAPGAGHAARAIYEAPARRARAAAGPGYGGCPLSAGRGGRRPIGRCGRGGVERGERGGILVIRKDAWLDMLGYVLNVILGACDQTHSPLKRVFSFYPGAE